MFLKRIAVGLLAVAAILGLTAGVSWSTTTGHPGKSVGHSVRCNTDWTQNADETTRKPVQKSGGMLFSDTDLIHHKVYGGLTVEHLHPGYYHAATAPGQPSFFSVEVSGSDGGYATLRWNPSVAKWEMSTGGQFYQNADPAALVDMPTSHKSHHVISFGVGFTVNPPGTVTTLVSSVTFNHRVYWLGCKPVHHRPHGPKPTPTTPTPTPTQTTPTTPPGEAPIPVPVTGDPANLGVTG
jgi:hypothetical protein